MIKHEKTWQWYCVLIIINWYHCCFPHTFFVDINHQNSNDSNKGTLTNPWKTIQHAVDILLPGDTVFIRQGSYYENLTTQRSGNTTDGYITFSAYPQETPVINGTGVAASNTGFTITHSYIQLIGLELKNWINGIWMEEADNVLISACEIHQVVYGIGAADGTHDFRLDSVVMHHFDLYGFDASPSGGKDCYNGKFYNCVSHTGRDDTQNVDGFALGHGTQHNFIFDNCLTYNVYDGFDLSSRNTTLTGCTARECWNSGYKIWQDSVTLINCLSYNNSIANVEIDWDGKAKKVSLINCTFHQADTYNIWIENSSDILYMINCILSGGDNIGLAFEQHSAKNYQGDYNLFHNDNEYRVIAVGYSDEFSWEQIKAGEWMTYSGQDSHSLYTDEASQIYISPATNDFHLKDTSPAIDKGTALGAPSYDYEGNSRPAGNNFDIGAYEYQPDTDIRILNHNQYHSPNIILYSNYPNPFNSNTTITYYLKCHAYINLDIVDVFGRIIRNLMHSSQNSGVHQITWDGKDNLKRTVSSGVYFLKIQNKTCVLIKKMLFLK